MGLHMFRPGVFRIGMTLSLLAAASSDARAQGALIHVNAAGACKGATPAYDDQLRSKPTGIRNEGVKMAFVSCSLPGVVFASLDRAAIQVVNTNASAVTVTCTLVNGRHPLVYVPVYETRTLVIEHFEWFVYDLTTEPDPPPGDLPNFSCGLPPGTEISVLLKRELDPA